MKNEELKNAFLDAKIIFEKLLNSKKWVSDDDFVDMLESMNSWINKYALSIKNINYEKVS